MPAGMVSRDMQMEQDRRTWEEDEFREMEEQKQRHARVDEKLEVGMQSSSTCGVLMQSSSVLGLEDKRSNWHCALMESIRIVEDLYEDDGLAQAFEEIQEEARKMGSKAASRKFMQIEQARQQREKLKAAFLKQQIAAKLASRQKKEAVGT